MILNSRSSPGRFHLRRLRLIGVANLLIAAVLLGGGSIGWAAAKSNGSAVIAPNGPTKGNVDSGSDYETNPDDSPGEADGEQVMTG